VKLARVVAIPIAVHRVYYENPKKNDENSLGELRDIYLNNGLFREFEDIINDSLKWLDDVIKRRTLTNFDLILKKELITALACLYAQHFPPKLDDCFYLFICCFNEFRCSK
jgi:hypothetical protein